MELLAATFNFWAKAMDIKITTTQLDVTIGLNAYNAYKAGDHKKAIDYLIQILDVEPQNWQARLYLGLSYAKTDQLFAAQRAFRFMYDNCPDGELKQKALTAMHEVNAQIQGKNNKPEEFGRYSGTAGVVWRG